MRVCRFAMSGRLEAFGESEHPSSAPLPVSIQQAREKLSRCPAHLESPVECHSQHRENVHKMRAAKHRPWGLRRDRVAYLDSQGLQVHLVAEVAHAAAGGEERLGGHAAAVDARAPDIVPLHHCDLHALLHSMQRCTVTADSTANDDEIVVVSALNGRSGHAAHGHLRLAGAQPAHICPAHKCGIQQRVTLQKQGIRAGAGWKYHGICLMEEIW